MAEKVLPDCNYSILLWKKNTLAVVANDPMFILAPVSGKDTAYFQFLSFLTTKSNSFLEISFMRLFVEKP